MAPKGAAVWAGRGAPAAVTVSAATQQAKAAASQARADTGVAACPAATAAFQAESPAAPPKRLTESAGHEPAKPAEARPTRPAEANTACRPASSKTATGRGHTAAVICPASETSPKRFCTREPAITPAKTGFALRSTPAATPPTLATAATTSTSRPSAPSKTKERILRTSIKTITCNLVPNGDNLFYKRFQKGLLNYSYTLCYSCSYTKS